MSLKSHKHSIELNEIDKEIEFYENFWKNCS